MRPSRWEFLAHDHGDVRIGYQLHGLASLGCWCALGRAVSMAALARFADDGRIGAGRLADTLVPRLMASVTASPPKS